MLRNAIVFATLATFALPLSAEWKTVGPGVDYREYTTESRVIHVTRVNLRNQKIRVVSTREVDKGTTVSQYAKRNNAIVAINGDYFDEKRNPIGLAIGACGQWEGTADTKREGVLTVDEGRGRIYAPHGVLTQTDEISMAVSGWPLLVKSGKPIPSEEMPGSKSFTHGPHPRTAVGLSADRRKLYLVVAEGRRQGVPGLTLPELAEFMTSRLGVSSAINLDGGGSSAMWVAGCIVNETSDGRERAVSNHIGVVLEEDFVACDDTTPPEKSYLAACPRVTRTATPSASAKAPGAAAH